MNKKEVFNHYSEILDELISNFNFFKTYFQDPFFIDEEVNVIMKNAYDEALRLINEHIDVLHETARLLLEKEKITGDEFRALFKKDEVVEEAVEEVAETVETTEE